MVLPDTPSNLMLKKNTNLKKDERHEQNNQVLKVRQQGFSSMKGETHDAQSQFFPVASVWQLDEHSDNCKLNYINFSQ